MVNAVQDYSKFIDPKLVDPLRNVSIGRKLVYVTDPKGFGISSVDWGTISDVSAGKVSYGFTDGNEDVIDVALTNAKIPVYWKDYRVKRRTYEAWRRNNTDIDAASAISAAYQALSAEDAAILNGVSNDGTNYDINGLYQGAGNDYSTSADFGTWGNAIVALAGAKKLMVDDGVPAGNMPLNMVLASTQAQQLMASVHSTSGQLEMPIIEKMLNGGSIYSAPETILSAGTGLVLPTPAVGEPYVDFFLTQDFQTEHGVDSKHPDTGDLNGRVYSAGILRIKHSVAICKLSSI